MNATRNRMTSVAMVSVLASMLSACASVGSAPEVVIVDKESITVRGEKQPTIAALCATLGQLKVRTIEVRPLAGAGYEEVGKAIYGASRCGFNAERVGPLIEG